jgi:hypothetical protein
VQRHGQLGLEGFGGPARPSPIRRPYLNGGYANKATVVGTIAAWRDWLKLRLAVSSARNTRLEQAPCIGSSVRRPQQKYPALGPFLLILC